MQFFKKFLYLLRQFIFKCQRREILRSLLIYFKSKNIKNISSVMLARPQLDFKEIFSQHSIQFLVRFTVAN